MYNIVKLSKTKRTFPFKILNICRLLCQHAAMRDPTGCNMTSNSMFGHAFITQSTAHKLTKRSTQTAIKETLVLMARAHEGLFV